MFHSFHWHFMNSEYRIITASTHLELHCDLGSKFSACIYYQLWMTLATTLPSTSNRKIPLQLLLRNEYQAHSCNTYSSFHTVLSKLANKSQNSPLFIPILTISDKMPMLPESFTFTRAAATSLLDGIAAVFVNKSYNMSFRISWLQCIVLFQCVLTYSTYL